MVKKKFPKFDFKQYAKIDYKELYLKEKQRAEEAEEKLFVRNFAEARNELFKKTINDVLSDVLKDYDKYLIKTITFKFDPTVQKFDDLQCKCTYISIE